MSTARTAPAPLVIAPEARPRSLDLLGEQLTVLASGTQTGSFELFFQSGPEGSGPPPHAHPWDEAFYVLRGEVGFQVDGTEQLAGTGTMVFVPGGTLHAFRLGAGGAEMLSITSKAGAAAFFTDLAAGVSPDAPDLGAIVAIAAAHGATIPLPPAEAAGA